MNKTATVLIVAAGLAGFFAGTHLRSSPKAVNDDSGIASHSRHHPTLLQDHPAQNRPAQNPNELRGRVHVDMESRLVLPIEFLSQFYEFPGGNFIDDSGQISDNAVRLLALPVETVSQLQGLVDQISSEVGRLERANAEYQIDETSFVEWVRVRDFDVSHLEARLSNQVTSLLGPGVAEYLLKTHQVQWQLLGRAEGRGKVLRFEREEGGIRVRFGQGLLVNEADITMFSRLPDPLPWWLARLISAEDLQD